MPRLSKSDLMSLKKITVLRGALKKPAPSPDSVVISIEKLGQWVARGEIFKHLFRYKEAQQLSYCLEFMYMPFLTSLLLRLLSRGKCVFRDEQGNSKSITVKELASQFWQYLRDIKQKKKLIGKIDFEVSKLLEGDKKQKSGISLDLSLTPVYLRTDLWFGVHSGGSVGHIAGVVNNLDKFSGSPVFLSTDTIPTVRSDIETHYIYPEREFWSFYEVPSLFFNEAFERNARQILNEMKLSFIYQRYSINNYSGYKLSRYYNIPFVLEYNGSEIWINRHWGIPLKYESLSEKIEMLNLLSADVIVAVSAPMKDELVKRGIVSDKVLVNPNGVNPERYSPDLEGADIRSRFDIRDRTVIGFIGTFDRWHGAEVLAKSVKNVITSNRSIHFLFIGDGITMPQVKEIIKADDVSQYVTFAGLIPQSEAPEYLAACDVLVSPHVPNPDGTPFFGSPTKLFEYMAMGRAIVASDLDQIGEVLEHEKTAWMVKPGDVEELAGGIIRLAQDKGLRNKLAFEARKGVLKKYTWEKHVEKILEALRERTT